MPRHLELFPLGSAARPPGENPPAGKASRRRPAPRPRAAPRRRDRLRPAATAIILAGGASRRLGRDKSLLPVDGAPLIARLAAQLAFFPERLVSANDPAKYAFLGLPVVADRAPGQGPLMGILSAVERAAHDLCFVTACDCPVLDRDFVLRLLDSARACDIAVPRHPDGRTEPLLAVYRKSIIPVAESLLARGRRRVAGLFAALRVAYLPAGPLDWYRNLNTMDDYRRFAGRAARSAP